MTEKLDTVFETNRNKDFLRNEFDYAHVERWYKRHGKRLNYLGLPAWKMLDIISWEKFLNRFTTIERKETEQHLMFLQANVRDVEHRLYSLYGDFAEILLQGRDTLGKQPEWPFDVVNLDYFGGFIYSNLSRPKAFRKLISNQAEHQRGFLLVVTHDVRDRDVNGAKLSFVDDLRHRLKGSTSEKSTRDAIDRAMDWYEDPENPDWCRQGLLMNTFLHDTGETEHFDVECRPPILYSGTGKSSMIHFVTDFVFRPGAAHKTASKQSIFDVVDLGNREVKDARLIKSTTKAPLLAVG